MFRVRRRRHDGDRHGDEECEPARDTDEAEAA
jgi:hypothetical protein